MRFVLWGLGIGLSVFLVYYLRGVLFPFFAAFLLAYIVDPIVNWLQKKVKHRVVAVIIVLFAVLLILFGFGKFFIPQIVREVQTLGVLITRLFTDSEWLSRLNEILPANLLDSVRSPFLMEQDGNYSVCDRLDPQTTSCFGHWQLPLTIGYTYTASQYGLKVCAGGGVTNADDVKKLLAAGAVTVQSATFLTKYPERAGELWQACNNTVIT